MIKIIENYLKQLSNNVNKYSLFNNCIYLDKNCINCNEIYETNIIWLNEIKDKKAFESFEKFKKVLDDLYDDDYSKFLNCNCYID